MVKTTNVNRSALETAVVHVHVLDVSLLYPVIHFFVYMCWVCMSLVHVVISMQCVCVCVCVLVCVRVCVRVLDIS